MLPCIWCNRYGRIGLRLQEWWAVLRKRRSWSRRIRISMIDGGLQWLIIFFGLSPWLNVNFSSLFSYFFIALQHSILSSLHSSLISSLTGFFSIATSRNGVRLVRYFFIAGYSSDPVDQRLLRFVTGSFIDISTSFCGLIIATFWHGTSRTSLF